MLPENDGRPKKDLKEGKMGLEDFYVHKLRACANLLIEAGEKLLSFTPQV